MTNTSSKTTDDTTINIIKQYISPVLFSIIGLFLWRDVSEMRTDIKTLLDNQSSNRVRIEILQQDVTALKVFVYGRSNNSDDEGPVIKQKYNAKKEEENEINSR